MAAKRHMFLLAGVLLLAPAVPAWAQGVPVLLAKPDAAITLKVDEVPLGELLAFLAAVGQSTVTLEREVQGTVRGVSFEGLSVEAAFQQLLVTHGLAVRRVGSQLIISRGARAATPPPPFTPDRLRPELLRPPTP